MATYWAEGITLLTRKYKGTSRVVVFFTRERGKVEAVAQGVGKPGSSLAPAVELFAHSKLFFAEGRQLDRLTQARMIDSFEALRRDPVKLGYAGMVCDLYALATEPGEAMPEAFEELLTFLVCLNGGQPARPLAAAVTWRFLERVGVGPELDRCARCARELQRDEPAFFMPVEGGAACGSCTTGAEADGLRIDPQLRAVASAMLRLPIDTVTRITCTEQQWARIITAAELQITYHLGLQLKSLSYLRQVDQ